MSRTANCSQLPAGVRVSRNDPVAGLNTSVSTYRFKISCFALLSLVTVGLLKITPSCERKKIINGHFYTVPQAAVHRQAVGRADLVSSVNIVATPTDNIEPLECSNKSIQNIEQPQRAVELQLISAAIRLIGTAESAEIELCQKLIRLMLTGKEIEAIDVDRRVLESLSEKLNEKVCIGELAAFYEYLLGVPGKTTLQNHDTKKSLLGLYDATVLPSEVKNSLIVITDNCDDDGTVNGRIYSIPRGTRRVYAVFENVGDLMGMEQVLAIWRDVNDKRLVFTECEPLRTSSEYNYVYLEIPSGWPRGQYQVRLCDPASEFKVLAAASFSVE